MSTPRNDPWAVVLAADDAASASAPDAGSGGPHLPRALWAPPGSKTLLRRALDRAERAVPRTRIVTVVDACHLPRFEEELEAGIPGPLVVQPEPRGSAATLLLALSHIHRHDPDSSVVVLPAHHHVGQEWMLQVALHRALEEMGQGEARFILLGMIPEGPEEGNGWVVPAVARRGPLSAVVSLCSTSSYEEAERLLATGGLLNSSMWVASTRELLRLFRFRLPQLSIPLEPLLGNDLELEELAYLFDQIPCLDLIGDLLPKALDSLSVLAVPPCGWNDLGTPERVARWWELAPPQRLGDHPPAGPNLLHQLDAARGAMEVAGGRGQAGR